MFHGHNRALTPEELASAIEIDPSQIVGLSPSLDVLIAMLEERKRKILETYETKKVVRHATEKYHELGSSMLQEGLPKKFEKAFELAYREEQIYDLERIWYGQDDEHSRFSHDLVHLGERLGEKYQIDDLASKYDFTGNQSMTIEEALEIKEELEKIDELLEQLREAKKNAKVGLIDMEKLSEFAQQGQIEDLQKVQQQIAEYLKQMAEMQGLEESAGGFELTPKAMRIFQGKLLERIFSDLQAARSGRHAGPIQGEGSVELPQTKQYEFGDSIANMDVTQTLINAMIRERNLPSSLGRGSISLKSEDIEIHQTRNNPKCATAVILDMSGSMRHDGQYVNAKRMALALDGLIRSEYPGDFLRFIEMYSFARPVSTGEIAQLMPKPVTVRSSIVRLKVDMSRDDILEIQVPPHFTNIQRSLQMARQFLASQDTPNKQIVLITDGLPTAHFENEELYLLYPPDPRTEEATMREARLCQRDGITINFFLLPNWWQSEEDVQFSQRMAEQTGGRVFFTAGHNLDRFVVWDYVNRKRSIIG